MKEKLNWKSKIINDIIDLKALEKDFKKNDKTKKDDNTSKTTSIFNKNNSSSSDKTSTGNISVSINKNIPRNQKWKASLINKIKEGLFNNDSTRFANILKKVNEEKKKKEEKEKEKEKEKRKINNDKNKDSTKNKSKLESVVINDDKNDDTIVVDDESSNNIDKNLNKSNNKSKSLIDDDIIMIDSKSNKRKRTTTKSKKKIENNEKEKITKNEDKTVKKRKRTKKEKSTTLEKDTTKKKKIQPKIPRIKYPVLSKMDNLDEKFELTYIIRPNSKREHAEFDDSVCIWDCAFEPTIEGKDASHIVATCGANTVSMIECHTGKVIAKYTNLIEVENYYSLDWTIVKVNSESQQKQNQIDNKKKKNSKKKETEQSEVNNNDNNKKEETTPLESNSNDKNQYCPILAAGGQLGEIIFLNRMQGECFRYAEPKVSKPQPITQIRFSKDNPKWLFAGSEDRYVYLYDMGELNDTEQDAATNLAKFVGLKKDPTAINVNRNNLIVGCSDGSIVIYNLSNIPTVEEAKKSAHLVNISISHKFSSLHNTYIDDIIPYTPQYHQDSSVNTFFTRGAKDHISLWSVDNLDSPIQKKTTTKRNSKKSESTIGEELIPTTLSELEWTHYVECVRFSLVNDEDETLLLTGSGAGNINIYKLQEDKSLKLITTFKHEQSGEAIHKVVLSKDKKYLVGVNEINLAFIWKLK